LVPFDAVTRTVVIRGALFSFGVLASVCAFVIATNGGFSTRARRGPVLSARPSIPLLIAFVAILGADEALQQRGYRNAVVRGFR